MAYVEFKTEKQVNYGWNLTWNPTGKFPIIAKRAFLTLKDAQNYVDDPKDTACEGLVLSVFKDNDNNGIYLVSSVGDGTNAGKLELAIPKIKKDGDGTKFLADDGNYKEIEVSSAISDVKSSNEIYLKTEKKDGIATLTLAICAIEEADLDPNLDGLVTAQNLTWETVNNN